MVACGVLKMGRDTGILGIMWIQRVHKMILNGKLKTLLFIFAYICVGEISMCIVFVCVFACLGLCMHAHACVSMHVFEHVCVHVYALVCVCEYMHVYMCTCMCMCVCEYM